MLGAPGFSDQIPVELVIGGYALKAPSRHPLLEFLNPKSPHYQPYREAGLIKTVEALARAGRSGTALDIGANIGDSCAIIHHHGGLKIICIEPSDFFFAYLSENITGHFRERARPRQAFVLADAGQKPQGLFHWGGTARTVAEPYGEKGEAVVLSQLLDEVPDLALLKMDIDGLDLTLVSAALDHNLACPIFFELEFSWSGMDEIRKGGAEALALFAKAEAKGYADAFLWDDRGRFFGQVGLSDVAALSNAINYMAQVQDRPVWGFDICLARQDDADFRREMLALLSAETAVPIAP